MKTVFLLLVVLAALAVAAAVASDKGDRPSSSRVISQLWRKEGRASASHVKRISIVLRHPTEELRAKFLSCSDPRSSQYGQYWSHEELCRATAPLAESVSAVQHFLASNGLLLRETNVCGEVLYVEGTVQQLEKAFATRLYNFVSRQRGGVSVIATDQGVLLPANIDVHVSVVHGLSQFPYFSPRHDNRALALGDTGVATPAILRTLYDITDAVSPVGSTNSTQAAAGWEHESYSRGDLEHFQDHFKLASNPVRLEVQNLSVLPSIPSLLYPFLPVAAVCWLC
jgi:subtilase family serine protease